MPYLTRSGVSGLAALLQPRGQFLLRDDLLDAAANDGELFFNGRKRVGIGESNVDIELECHGG